MTAGKKLNLGCGNDCKPNYINVDKHGTPDLSYDLEKLPWPWEDSSVEEVLLIHVLEHLGESRTVYLDIVKELYRICKKGARVNIVVPHPRHDDFLNDPTHVRPITPASLNLFSKSKNRLWMSDGSSNTPLGLHMNVDFEMESVEWILDPVWEKLLRGKGYEIISQARKRYNNVVKEIKMVLRVVK